jgi:hypothetical protein
MQPLDRDNAQVRRDAAAMLAATLHKRVENGEQRTRMRLLREAGATATVGGQDARAISDALWEPGLLAGAATAAASLVGAIKTRPELWKPVQFTEREGEALGRASDGRVTWSLG